MLITDDQIIVSLLFLQGAGNIPNFCDVGLKISGMIPIVETAAMTFHQTLATSVTLASIEQHTVAFLGTNNGHVKKVSKYDNAISNMIIIIIMD